MDKAVFPNASMHITSLSIKCNDKGSNDFPRKFIVYGGNGNAATKEIARTEDITYFTQHGQVVNFPVTPGYYNTIMLKNEGKCESQKSHFCISDIEFFGSYSCFYVLSTSNAKHRYSFVFVLIFVCSSS